MSRGNPTTRKRKAPAGLRGASADPSEVFSLAALTQLNALGERLVGAGELDPSSLLPL